jgi:hypothetical protein
VSLPYRARVNERTLLNLPGFHGGAHVYVYVEDTSRRGPWREPNCDDDCVCCPRNFEPRMIVELSAGGETVSLAFDLDTREGRRNSVHKLDTIVSALRVFRQAFLAEYEPYDRRDRELESLRD